MDKENEKDYKCPWCHSHISHEKYNKLMREHEALKKEHEKSKQEVEKYKKLSEQSKNEIAKINREHKEELRNIEKNVRSSERKKLGDRIEKLNLEIKRLKEGKTAQEIGFDYEKELYGILKAEFGKHDLVEKTGHLGDIRIKVKSKGKVVGIILLELKKVAKHSEAHVEELRRHKIEDKADYGLLVTNGDFGRVKMDGLKIIEDIIVIRPNSVIDFVKILRGHLVDIDSYKISLEEKEKERLKLWQFIHSMEFETQMNSILKDINQFRKLDKKESGIIEKRSEIEDNLVKAHNIIVEGIRKTRNS